MNSSSESHLARVALVTGASRNIGRAIADALAAEGVHVAVHAARDENGAGETLRMVEARGAEGIVALGDLCEEDTATRIMRQVLDRFGQLDILVNNAAIRPESPFAAMTYAEWRRVLGVCLDAVFLTTQAALPLLQKSTQGAIINLGGLTAHTGAAHRAHVIAAKSGVVGLTRALAHELSPDGITVNCVAPGLIETVREGKNSPHHHATRTHLIDRRGRPEDVAAAVAYLAGPSGRYITGQTLHVNGGAYLP